MSSKHTFVENNMSDQDYNINQNMIFFPFFHDLSPSHPIPSILVSHTTLCFSLYLPAFSLFCMASVFNILSQIQPLSLLYTCPLHLSLTSLALSPNWSTQLPKHCNCDWVFFFCVPPTTQLAQKTDFFFFIYKTFIAMSLTFNVFSISCLLCFLLTMFIIVL